MLEEALSSFEVRPRYLRRSLSQLAHPPAAQGTVLAVSHDRYFLRKIATRVLELKNGVIDDYSGDYECASFLVRHGFVA
jgi:ABC-type sulfate/molybdate transport systems ATPase subunit